MKKNDWLLVASALIFSVLFYEQAPGLNFLLFTILLNGLIVWFNPANLKHRAWWYYAGLTMLCSFSVFVCNSALSVFATLFSFLVLSGKSYNTKNSILINVVFGFYSVLSSGVYFLMDVNARRMQRITANITNRTKVYVGIAVAIVFSIIFFALYQQANPLFKDFTHKIDLSWIDLSWFLFTVFGFLLIYGLLFYRDVKYLREVDVEANHTIKNTQLAIDPSKGISGNAVVALTLFGLLNVMLLFINGLDINNLFISKSLPEGITLSDFVHNAVWGLVFSIVIAVGFIIWFFTDELNFNKQSKSLKFLVYLWIVQSALMVVSAMVRNSWYIEGYQLSYLRIGVYLFLFLSLVGLFFTYLKISNVKSGWYLARQNFEAWFLILALCSYFNWDKYITDYNIAHAKNYESLDKAYLLDLSDAALPQLAELMFINSKPQDMGDKNFRSLSRKIYYANNKRHEITWQNFNLRSSYLDDETQKMLNEKKINLLDLRSEFDVELSDLLDFRYIETLGLKDTPVDFDHIVFFKNLRHLVIEDINRASIKNLALNKNLKHLEITEHFYGNISLDIFKNLKHLEELSLPEISNEGLLQLNNHPSLKVLRVKTLYQDQIGFMAINKLSFYVTETEHEKR